MLRLPSVIFIVLITIPFLGSYPPELNAGPCEQSCKTDCQGITGQERGVCIRQCLGGRCDNHGVQTAAQMLGKAGFDCSADGQCNAFCESTPDPDCVYFPPGHAGFAVKVFYNGTIVDVTDGSLVVNDGGTAAITYDNTIVLTSPLDCASVQAPVCRGSFYLNTPNPVPTGAVFDYYITQAVILGAGNTDTSGYCSILSNANNGKTVLGTTVDISPAALGHNIVVIPEDEIDGVAIKCMALTPSTTW